MARTFGDTARTFGDMARPQRTTSSSGSVATRISYQNGIPRYRHRFVVEVTGSRPNWAALPKTHVNTRRVYVPGVRRAQVGLPRTDHFTCLSGIYQLPPSSASGTRSSATLLLQLSLIISDRMSNGGASWCSKFLILIY